MNCGALVLLKQLLRVMDEVIALDSKEAKLYKKIRPEVVNLITEIENAKESED